MPMLLRASSNADILVPGGTVSILGTTPVRIDSLDDIRPTVQEMDFIVGEGAQMIPALETTRYIRAYAGVRPLLWDMPLIQAELQEALYCGFLCLDL